MKLIKSLVLTALFALCGSSAAWADHGHSSHGHSNVRVGISVGVPFYSGYYGGPRYYGGAYYGYAPRYYGSPYYAPYYPGPVYSAPVVISQPVVMQPQQQVYVEQPQQQQQQAAGVQPYENSPYWYFCAERNAYYPYVKSCPSGWQQVKPTPPAN